MPRLSGFATSLSHLSLRPGPHDLAASNAAFCPESQRQRAIRARLVPGPTGKGTRHRRPVPRLHGALPPSRAGGMAKLLLLQRGATVDGALAKRDTHTKKSDARDNQREESHEIRAEHGGKAGAQSTARTPGRSSGRGRRKTTQRSEQERTRERQAHRTKGTSQPKPFPPSRAL